MPVTLADDPLGSVVLGTGRVLEELENLKKGAHHEQEVLQGAVLLDGQASPANFPDVARGAYAHVATLQEIC